MELCGAKRKGGGTCRNVAGKNTDHVGQGRCWLHGGATPIKTGRYSTVKRETLRDRIAQFEADPDPLNLASEVALLRAFTLELIERWDEIYGPDGALLAWHESFRNPDNPAPPKPRQLPDFSAVTSVVDRVGAMVDRIQKHKAEGAVSLVTLNRYVEQLGAEVVASAQETVTDADAREKLLDAVERRWHSVRLDAGQQPRRARSEAGEG